MDIKPIRKLSWKSQTRRSFEARSRQAISLAMSIFLCSVLSSYGNATDLTYEISAGAGRSDNIGRTETNTTEETIALLGLKLNLAHLSRRIDLSLVTDLEYRSYLDDTFDDETVGALAADLVVQLAPELLSWAFEYRFGNLQTNPFQPNTPTNRENAQSFTTGPDLHLRLGSLTAFEVSGRYGSNKFEASDIDNDILSGRISLVRDLSKHRSISLNTTADKVEFNDRTINDNYDRLTAYLGLESEISDGTLSLKAGVNQLQYDGAEETDGNLYGISWTRDLDQFDVQSGL